MYKKILVPTDGSELSDRGVSAAIDFARMSGAEIVAFSVAEPASIPAAEGSMAIDLAVEADQRQHFAQDSVDKVARAAQAAGVPCTTAVAFSSRPDQEIIDIAVETNCDLIFLASHGRRGLGRLLAGSVAQYVLTHSTIAVMLLRPLMDDHRLRTPDTPRGTA